MQTQIAERGIFAVSGNVLSIQRREGVISNSNNYGQPLGPQTTNFQFKLGGTQTGLGMELTYPNGGTQVFYR